MVAVGFAGYFFWPGGPVFFVLTPLPVLPSPGCWACEAVPRSLPVDC
ncbi:hypothetical protein FHS42_001108 [Streptomyces zagrosensis]|uniref:Uncharacterized protein n=1 Tax=Streptomyces zagrosensis TaxID=1042984 RepID=A0A7W9UWZ8_9ACTN|nr:hypothetical protein [Streptomyces zagrosensis]